MGFYFSNLQNLVALRRVAIVALLSVFSVSAATAGCVDLLRYAEPPSLPSGPFKGNKLSPRFASLQNLSAADAERIFKSEDLTVGYAVANLLKGERRYAALIPKGKVGDVSLLIESNDQGARHVLLRIQFPTDGIKAVDQATEETIDELHDVVFDAGSWIQSRETGAYDAVKGRNGSYGLRREVADTGTRIEAILFTKGRSLTEYPMILSDRQKSDLLASLILQASEQKTVLYHTTHQNCATELLKILNPILSNAENDSFLFSVLRKYSANSPKKILNFLERKRAINKADARAFLVGDRHPNFPQFVRGDSRFPISYGLEIEFDLSRSENLLDYYRPGTISESKWIRMSAEARKKTLLQWDPEKNLWSRTLSLLKARKLIKLGSAPGIFPESVVLERHGTYEMRGMIFKTQSKWAEFVNTVEAIIPNGYFQGHVAFPRTPLLGVAGFEVYESDKAQIFSLVGGLAAYLRDANVIPGGNIVHYALAPFSNETRAWARYREEVLGRGEKIGKGGRHRLVLGPVLRDDVYPDGRIGFELRQYGAHPKRLVAGMKDITEKLVGDKIRDYSVFAYMDLVDWSKRETIFEQYFRDSSLKFLDFETFFDEIGVEIERQFPIFGKARSSEARESFFIPFRNWENYPTLENLDLTLVAEIRSKIRSATVSYVSAVTKIQNSNLPRAKQVIQMRIALAQWADSGGIVNLFTF